MSAKEKKALDNITRRTFIKKLGGGILVVSFAGLTWRMFDQGVFSTGEGPAYEPWDTDKEILESKPLALVSDAILASNPHNTQPWLFKVTDSSIELYADESRNLGAFDPLRREMFIGLGCAIENLMLSAYAHGYEPKLRYKPNSLEPACIARIDLTQSEKDTSPLYKAIPQRHTHRGEYNTDRLVPKTTLRDIENLIKDEKKVNVSWFSSSKEKQNIGDLIVEATEAIIADEEMSAESNKWFKENWKDIQEERDGITLDAQGSSFFIRSMGKILPPMSHESNNQFWLSSTEKVHTATAATYGVISVRDANDNVQRARAGRAWQRIHLHGTNIGLGMQPLNQLNEMADREKKLRIKEHFGNAMKEITGDSAWKGIFIFRCGYPLKETHPSPRRSVDDVIL
ncbi:Acg family FMN-binding oxidoreductase [Oceanobacillus manasiensis]|uniref:Acg family FMN-binding oxidoreductase n=1 Tax=Oceanobacillus manasiensis TaxID=586413 RepID=UPI000693E9DA|nr:nitroreductase family protein [Oceanobacillus manasiensis]